MEPVNSRAVLKFSDSFLLIVALHQARRQELKEGLHRSFLEIGIPLAGYYHAVPREGKEESNCLQTAGKGLAVIEGSGKYLIARSGVVEFFLPRISKLNLELHYLITFNRTTSLSS